MENVILPDLGINFHQNRVFCNLQTVPPQRETNLKYFFDKIEKHQNGKFKSVGGKMVKKLNMKNRLDE